MAEPPSVVVIDIETTGLDVTDGAIIEVAAERYSLIGQRFECVEPAFQTLVKPRIPIEPAAVEIHGISEVQAQAEGQEPAVALRAMADFIDDDYLLAHNGVFFDYLYIPNECARHGVELAENRLLDTLLLARKHLKSSGGYGMASLCEAYGIVNEQAHRALSDVRATGELFRRIVERESDLERLWKQSYGYTLRSLRETPEGFELLQRAIDDRRKLHIEYQSTSKPRRRRWIRPLRLDLTRAGKRSVRAVCLESNTEKQFRLDRISELIELQ